MAKKTKAKLFLHHQVYQEFDSPEFASKTKRTFQILQFLENALYNVGLGVLWVAKRTSKVKNISHVSRAGTIYITESTQSLFSEFSQAFQKQDFRATLAVFLLLTVAGVSILQSGPAVSYALQIKQQVLGAADGGVAQLTEAQKLLEGQQIGAAQNKFNEALASFEQSKQELRDAGAVINGLSSILPQKRDGENIIEAAAGISKAGVALTEAYESLESLGISSEGIIAKAGTTRNQLTNLEQKLTTARESIKLAAEKINAVSIDALPNSYRDQFKSAGEKLQIANKSLTATADLLSLTNSLILGNKHVLLIMQNNNELRPTGGFIGTFGALDVADGKITQMHISSIYDLDGQLTEKIIPPHPLYSVNNRWYLRDSNWFANFPESAKKITSFYEKEGGESPDLIMAITPHIITDLLAITGPIAMPRYDLTLTSDNFVELTQVATSVTYDKNQNQPKQLLADFVPVLLQKLSTIDTTSYIHLAEMMQQNLNGKHIILYSRDPELESRLEAYNWAGTLKYSDRDYLSIVSSNVGGTKTDLYITQEAKLESEIGEGGQIRNTLTITKTNPLPNQSEYKNTSYIRIYVPKGSHLEASQGFTFKVLEVPPLDDARPDDDVTAWEQQLLKNVASGTMIGEESGKTFFGNWLELEGGETKTVTVTYTLPYTLQSLDRHSLLLQKQAGALPFVFNYNINFKNQRLLWKNASQAEVQNHTAMLKSTINKDEFFGFVLSSD